MTVSAIIPAYNEETRIAAVVDTLKHVDSINEIIVVDDGSEDLTAYVANSLGIRVVQLQENRGKAYAMCRGVNEAFGDVVLFVDADLSGLQPQHVQALLKPVLTDRADMSVGIFSSGRAATDMAQLVSPQLSGQRVLKKKLFSRIAEGVEDAGYGIESIISKYAKKEGWEVVTVELSGVSQVTKEEKLGFSKGAVARIKMYAEIMKTVGNPKKISARKKGHQQI